ncbi:MAG: hypothetical protein KKD38_07550 [Candidatus Delongbacteria bacterium]|nr:hypothetical protein [Candidatus Delongbacteria bacterium]MCG2761529.1 hypothetical protein [Candidatus Delongbacteria bacterium]
MIKTEFKYIIFAIFITISFLFSKTDLEMEYFSKSVQTDKSDDLKILALRVEFVSDNLDYTTGNGKFDGEYPDSLLIDGIPHDKEYFEDQLEFVKNYFEAESNGNATISASTVLDMIVTLPHPMWYYNPNNGNDILEERLDSLYADSWSQIKDIVSIDFSSYNTFVIYHAGSGQEFNPGYDQTPFDIPSVFLSSGELAGKEIIAHDGTVIDNCVILPECEWQIFDGNWYYAGMGGISCLMFAHRFGIPNLYSSDDGKSCIGRFGLMDQGSANFSGMVPAGVSAWVKELKGWQGVKKLETPRKDIIINANDSLYKIDINSDEYLLVENRTPKNFTSSKSEIYGYDRDSLKIRFFYTKYGNDTLEIVDNGFKTLVSIQDNDYDFGLPLGFDIDNGSILPKNKGGILIWHIDKRKTTDYNIENNKVNDDYKNRGVYLEEADGSFDIGKDYWLLDNGYGTEFGWYYDAFFAGNDVWSDYANQSLNKGVEFSSISYPRSDTNDGIQTGIKLSGFSQISREMFFTYSFEEPEVYFSLDPGLGKSIYLPAYFDNEIRHYFVGSNGNYKIIDQDTVLFGALSDSVSAGFMPVQIGNDVMTVSSDSTKIFVTDISSGEFQSIDVQAKIVSQPVDRIIAADNGIYKLHDDFTFESISDEFKNAEKLSVLTDDGDMPVFIKGENNGILFTIDISELPYITETRTMPQNSVNYTFILTDQGRYQKTHRLFSYPIDDQTIRLVWTDTDHDKKLESYSAEGNILNLKNENGIYENGFPLYTDLGHISKAFVFDGNIAVIDSSSNYAVISSGGDYDNTAVRTINGFGENSGLLSVDGSVFLYNHSENGILTYHKIGTGTLDDYFDRIKGVVVLMDTIENCIPTTIVSGNVYNWPNPVRDNETNFRFFLNEPCKVGIDIYDINGNKVETLDQNFTSFGEYAELVWNVRNIPSGIYNSVLSFDTGTAEEKKIVKVAVIK